MQKSIQPDSVYSDENNEAFATYKLVMQILNVSGYAIAIVGGIGAWIICYAKKAKIIPTNKGYSELGKKYDHGLKLD